MSTPVFELNCSVRTDLGKGASRRLRRLNNEIPAVLYGGGKDPVSLTIAHKEIVKATDNEAFFSHIITLNVDSKPEKAVIKALQRHPAKPFILHADFMRVNEKEEIQVRVPLHFLNEEKCVGVRLESGKLLKTLSEVEVACLPKDLPEYIEVDMLNVHAGTTIHISDLVLPDGVRSTDLEHGEDSDLAIATVKVKRGGSDADGAGAGAGAADGGEGEESSED